MNRLLRCSMPMLCAVLTFMPALAQTVPTPTPPGGRTPYKPKNLKVLPDDTDLRTVMRQYSGDLGVECEFCHAAPDPVTKRPDRSSDANPVKDTARFMIQMTGDLNTKYLAELPGRRYADPVTCGTCHRGEKHPSIFIPPPRQEGNRPPGAPSAPAPPAAAPAPPPAS